jgi:hypothetical protein
MAIQRLSLSNILTELLRIVGFASSTVSDWATNANLYNIVNRYGQSIPIRMSQASQSPKRLLCDMWRTVVASAATGTDAMLVAAGSSTVYLPVNCDYVVSVYDVTNKAKVEIITDIDRWHIDDIKKKDPGPPEVIELLGYTDYATDSSWRRYGTIYPATVTGTTPSFTLTYYRLPAIMPGVAIETEYPDADPKYHSLWIYGPAAELLGPSNPAYDRYAALEKELLLDLATVSRSS